MAQTVVGLFEQHGAAEKAVARLLNSGLTREQVDLGTGHIESISGGSKTKEDGVTGFFNALFGNNNDAARQHAAVAINKRCAIVTVHATGKDQAEKAAALLDDCGALDVSECARETGDHTGTTHLHATGTTSPTNAGTSETINRIQEDIDISKRTEEQGRVRVHSRIVEQPVEEHLRLREELVRVDRYPVNRAVTDSERAMFEHVNIELTERAEVPVIIKSARVVEEVHVRKEILEHDETIRDSVRRTEVDVERSGGAKQSFDDLHRDERDR